jgi:hypothetical protein
VEEKKEDGVGQTRGRLIDVETHAAPEILAITFINKQREVLGDGRPQINS